MRSKNPPASPEELKGLLHELADQDVQTFESAAQTAMSTMGNQSDSAKGNRSKGESKAWSEAARATSDGIANALDLLAEGNPECGTEGRSESSARSQSSKPGHTDMDATLSGDIPSEGGTSKIIGPRKLHNADEEDNGYYDSSGESLAPSETSEVEFMPLPIFLA